jgi:guanosine-3',5'-bis(diphosphate) 3'-pyrophosphohydrolase
MLHDVVEDTGTSPEEIEATFGEYVRSLVMEVTDDKSLPKAERKRLQVQTASGKSHGAKLIKLADKFSNLNDLLQNPIWEPSRMQGYFIWAIKVLEGLRGTNEALEAAIDRTLEGNFKIIGPANEEGFRQVTTYPALPTRDPEELDRLLEEYYRSL